MKLNEAEIREWQQQERDTQIEIEQWQKDNPRPVLDTELVRLIDVLRILENWKDRFAPLENEQAKGATYALNEIMHELRNDTL